jgi:hypothetical protein
MRKLAWAPVIALVAGVLTFLTPGTASAAAVEVRNTGGYGIGAVQFRDGVYNVPGKYDAVIPAGRFSGYPSTAGIYLGPGYCVRFRAWLRGTEQNPPGPGDLSDPAIIRAEPATFPGGRHLWFDNGSWDVKALPLSDSGCWNL